MNFEVFVFELLVGSKYTSASTVPFFDSMARFFRTPSVDNGGRKDEGMDREGSINHDPLIASVGRFKLTKLEGLILGIVQGRLRPDSGGIDDGVSVAFKYEGGISSFFHFEFSRTIFSSIQTYRGACRLGWRHANF